MELNILPKTMGDRIRAARYHKRMSQVELARQLKVHKTLISHWEGGRSKPSVAQLVSVSSALDVSLDFLAGLEQVTYA